MKIRTLFIFAVLYIFFAGSVSAEQSFDYTVSVKQINAAEECEKVDNSLMNIKVFKYVNNTENIIYQGRLGNYADGLLRNIDFDDVQCCVIFDWDNSDSDVLYVVPDVQAEAGEQNLNAKNVRLMSENENGIVENNISFIYNDKYYEKQLVTNEQINIETIVKSTKNTVQNIAVLVGVYDSSNKLIAYSVGSSDVIGTGDYKVVNSAVDIPDVEDAYLKAFVWNGNDLQPYELPETLIDTKEDYYSNSFIDAVLVDENREIIGKIDTVSDIDTLKFIPDNTGNYIIKITADESVQCSINNSNYQLISNAYEGVISTVLIADNEYYISMSGTQIEDYSVNIYYVGNTSSLTRDALINGQLTTGKTKTYTFIPTVTNTYIFTATAQDNMKARLFDYDYNLIDEDRVGDEDAVFRVSGELVAGQTYYLSLIADWDWTETVSYTEYTEVPMQLILIE